MPRTARVSAAADCYLALNRGNGRAGVFHAAGDYQTFAEMTGAASARLPMRCWRVACRMSFPGVMLPADGSRGILSSVTVAFLDRKDSAVNHIALDKEDEAVKRFVLSLPVAANGSVLELEGRAVACVVPILAEPVEANGAWSEAKNARRCALIDKEIDGRLSAGEAVELHLLQREMLAHRHKVAPLPLAEARELHQKLLTEAERRPGE